MMKQQMQMIDCKLVIFKAAQVEEMDLLRSEELGLEQDIKMIENRLDKKECASFHQEKSQKVNSKGGLLPEVVEYQNFVVKYGHEGGWDSINHAGFVNLKKKYSGDALYEICAQKLLGIDHETAAEHDRWYGKYLEKMEANKEAIRNWKKQKRSNQAKTEMIQKEIQQESQQSDEDLRKTLERRELQKFQLLLWKVESVLM